jgi:hypothetical protein
MHNLLEGVVPSGMALVLQKLISQGHGTVHMLSQKINCWPCEYLNRQKKLVPLSFGD